MIGLGMLPRLVAAVMLSPLLMCCALAPSSREWSREDQNGLNDDQWEEDGGTYSDKYDPSIGGYRLSQDKRPPKVVARAPVPIYEKPLPPKSAASPSPVSRERSATRSAPKPATPAAVPKKEIESASIAPAQPSSKSLAGLSEQEVRTLLGEPNKTADDSSRRMWTYDRAGCRLQVIFFFDVARSNYYAFDRKMLRRGEDATGDLGCLASSNTRG